MCCVQDGFRRRRRGLQTHEPRERWDPGSSSKPKCTAGGSPCGICVRGLSDNACEGKERGKGLDDLQGRQGRINKGRKMTTQNGTSSGYRAG